MPLGRHVVLAGLCHGHLVEHDKDEAVQEDGVEGHHQPRRLVARDEPDQRENHLQKIKIDAMMGNITRKKTTPSPKKKHWTNSMDDINVQDQLSPSPPR